MSGNVQELTVENNLTTETKKKESGKTGKTFITFFTCGLCTHGNKDDVKNKDDMKPKMKKNKSVNGTIKFDTTTNIAMWRSILDNSIIGTKLVTKGVICSKTTGAIFACNPTDFTPSVEQIEFISNGFENPDLLKPSGFMLVTDTYEPLTFGQSEFSARTKGDSDYYEALILNTNTAFIIGISPNPVDRIRDLLREIQSMVQNEGF